MFYQYLLIIRRKIERRKKTNKTLILVTVVFFLSWLPFNIFNFIYVVLKPFHLFELDPTIQGYAFIAVHFIGMTSVLTNPLMYGLLNPNFRKVSVKYLNFLDIHHSLFRRSGHISKYQFEKVKLDIYFIMYVIM